MRRLLSIFRSSRRPIRMGRVDNSLFETTRLRNAQFVSFMSENDCLLSRHPDRHDRRMRRQKMVKWMVKLAAGSGLAWVAIESARAFSMF